MWLPWPFKTLFYILGIIGPPRVTIHDLPPELLIAIFDQISMDDPEDIAMAAAACHGWNELATSVLHSRVKLCTIGQAFHWGRSPKKKSRPTYEVVILEDAARGTAYAKINDFYGVRHLATYGHSGASWAVFCDSAFDDLRTLRISKAHLFPPPTPEELIDGCLVPYFPKVHSLRITYTNDPRYGQIDSSFFRLVLRAVTPSLKLLSLEGGNNDMYLEASPELRELLPRIQHLVISSVLDPQEEYLAVLSYATSVTRLTFILKSDEMINPRFETSLRSVLDALPSRNHVSTVAIECSLAFQSSRMAFSVVTTASMRKLKRVEVPNHTMEEIMTSLYGHYRLLLSEVAAKGVALVVRGELPPNGQLGPSLGLGLNSRE